MRDGRRHDTYESVVLETKRLYGRKNIPWTRRKRVIERDGRVCWICRKSVRRGQLKTLDHVVSPAWGGNSLDANLKLAHESCNRLRGEVSKKTIHAVRRFLRLGYARQP